jgi:phospholipase/carboxylesterase
MSGALIARSEWSELAAKRAGLSVVQSHGAYDPILPIVAGERLRDLLKGAGLLHTWVPFGGGHEIPAPAVEAVSAFLEKQLA